MSTSTIRGTYGSGRNRADVFTYEKDGGTWYAVDGSTVANFTREDLEEGVNVEYLSDEDTLTWNEPIRSEEELQEAVDAGEEEDDSEDEEAADELIEEGEAMLDALGEELEAMTDAPAQRQTLNDTLDGWLKDNSMKLDELSKAQRDRVEAELASYCGKLHK